MNDRLLKIAKYLGQNGLYEEAGKLKKIAEDDYESSHKYIVVYKDSVEVNNARKEIKEAARRRSFIVEFEEPDDDKKIDLDTEDRAKQYDLVIVRHPLLGDHIDTMTFIERLKSVSNVIAVD